MQKKKSKRPGNRNARAGKPAAGTKRKTRLITSGGMLDLEHGLARMRSARAIAKSIKRAADAGSTLKASSFDAAMAAIAYLIHHLENQLIRLHEAQRELRSLYGQTVEEEEQRRLRMISDERAAVRAQRKRGRKKIDLAAAGCPCAVAT